MIDPLKVAWNSNPTSSRFPFTLLQAYKAQRQSISQWKDFLFFCCYLLRQSMVSFKGSANIPHARYWSSYALANRFAKHNRNKYRHFLRIGDYKLSAWYKRHSMSLVFQNIFWYFSLNKFRVVIAIFQFLLVQKKTENLEKLFQHYSTVWLINSWGILTPTI